MSHTLQEIDDNAFLAKVDALLEHLERQVGEDPVGGWAISAIKAEVRRRIMAKTSVMRNPVPTPITVEVEKVDLDEIISPDKAHAHFHGTPYLITLGGTIERGELTCQHGFLSTAEADAFLTGLVTASEFGLRFKEIPDIQDIPDKEINGEGCE